jgi:hypothetical protein
VIDAFIARPPTVLTISSRTWVWTQFRAIHMVVTAGIEPVTSTCKTRMDGRPLLYVVDRAYTLWSLHGAKLRSGVLIDGVFGQSLYPVETGSSAKRRTW